MPLMLPNLPGGGSIDLVVTDSLLVASSYTPSNASYTPQDKALTYGQGSTLCQGSNSWKDMTSNGLQVLTVKNTNQFYPEIHFKNFILNPQIYAHANGGNGAGSGTIDDWYWVQTDDMGSYVVPVRVRYTFTGLTAQTANYYLANNDYSTYTAVAYLYNKQTSKTSLPSINSYLASNTITGNGSGTQGFALKFQDTVGDFMGYSGEVAGFGSMSTAATVGNGTSTITLGSNPHVCVYSDQYASSIVSEWTPSFAMGTLPNAAIVTTRNRTCLSGSKNYCMYPLAVDIVLDRRFDVTLSTSTGKRMFIRFSFNRSTVPSSNPMPFNYQVYTGTTTANVFNTSIFSTTQAIPPTSGTIVAEVTVAEGLSTWTGLPPVIGVSVVPYQIGYGGTMYSNNIIIQDSLEETGGVSLGTFSPSTITWSSSSNQNPMFMSFTFPSNIDNSKSYMLADIVVVQ